MLISYYRIYQNKMNYHQINRKKIFIKRIKMKKKMIIMFNKNKEKQKNRKMY